MAMKQAREIDLARSFTPYPVGRTRSDGRYSGEAFRDDYLVPAGGSRDGRNGRREGIRFVVP